MSPEDFAVLMLQKAEGHRLQMDVAIKVGNHAEENYNRGALEALFSVAANARFALVPPVPKP